MTNILTEALIDTLKMAPFLFVIYCLVAWIEQKYGNSIQDRIRYAAKAGPLIGSLFGSVPQCGFSVLASAMYTRRLITIGTLLAVFLSTSDEAIPVILAQPDKIKLIIPLLLTKIVIGILGGYGVDFALRSYLRPHADEAHDHEAEINSRGCCEHDIIHSDKRLQLLIHPLVHTAKICAFLFVVTAALNYGMAALGPDNLKNLLLQNSMLQPVVTAFFGLIPNCAASVAITDVFLKGGISFGSAISGLCASGGLGILVLFKENSNLRDTIRVIGLLLCVSIIAGIVIQSIGWNPIKLP